MIPYNVHKKIMEVREMNKTEQIEVRMSKELKQRIKKRAEKEDRSMSSIVRLGARKYLEEE